MDTAKDSPTGGVFPSGAPCHLGVPDPPRCSIQPSTTKADPTTRTHPPCAGPRRGTPGSSPRRTGGKSCSSRCRARVEIEAHGNGGKKLLFVDRETEVAIDIAENVAAKSAVQAAGADLAERIVGRVLAEASK